MSDQGAAGGAGLVFSPVYIEVNLEISSGPAGIDEVTDRRAAAFNGSGKYFSDFVDQQTITFFTDSTRFSGGADCGVE